MEALGVEGTPIEVSNFDDLADMFNNQGDQGDLARKILYEISQRSDSWLLMHPIISESNNESSRALALNLFSQGIKKSWNILSNEQKDFYRKYYYDFAINCSEAGVNPYIQSNANAVLIEIVKNEWPFNWPNFTHTIINESKRGEAVCINILRILASLSDEIHAARDEKLTSDRLAELDEQLEKDFGLIFQHIESVLERADSVPLRAEGLMALSHYLGWIDLRLIISSRLCSQLVTELLPIEEYRIHVINCFTAIANHRDAKADGAMTQIFEMLIANLSPYLQTPEDIEYLDPELGSAIVDALSSFLLLDSCAILQTNPTQYNQSALNWMATFVAFTGEETFSTCIEMWYAISMQAVIDKHKMSQAIPPEIIIPLRTILVGRMARPTKFVIAISSDGELCLADNRTDTADAEFYNKISGTLFNLCRISNGVEVFDDILEKIRGPFTLENLPGYYSAGAIAGALRKDIDTKFVHSVLSVVNESLDFSFPSLESVMAAACFMYISSSYGHILRNDWTLLGDILSRFMEIIQNPCPQLQTYAINCLETISLSCYQQINSIHPPEKQSLTQQWLSNITHFIQILPFDAIPTLFGMFANLVKRYQIGSTKTELISLLFGPPIDALNSSIEQLTHGIDDSIEFTMGIIVPLDALGKVVSISDENFYEFTSQIIGQCCSIMDFYTMNIAKTGENFQLQRVKSALMKLFETFFEAFSTTETALELVGKLLEDFQSLDISLKCYGTLDAISKLIVKTDRENQGFIGDVINVLVFSISEELSVNMVDYPELRNSFFNLVSTIITHSIDITNCDRDIFENLMKFILFGVCHPQHQICEKCLNCISSVVAGVDGIDNLDFKHDFYSAFFLPIVETILEVLTDLSHKFIFQHIVQVFFHLMQIVWKGSVIIDSETDPRVFVSDCMSQKLMQLFPTLEADNTLNLSQSLVNEVESLEKFKQLLADFLINLRKASPKEAMMYKRVEPQENDQDTILVDETGEPQMFVDDATHTEISEF